MVAWLGLPGSEKHRWRRFTKKKAAQDWLWWLNYHLTMQDHTYIGIERGITSEKEAAKMRYSDGRKIFPKDKEGNER